MIQLSISSQRMYTTESLDCSLRNSNVVPVSESTPRWSVNILDCVCPFCYASPSFLRIQHFESCTDFSSVTTAFELARVLTAQLTLRVPSEKHLRLNTYLCYPFAQAVSWRIQ